MSGPVAKSTTPIGPAEVRSFAPRMARKTQAAPCFLDLSGAAAAVTAPAAWAPLWCTMAIPYFLLLTSLAGARASSLAITPSSTDLCPGCSVTLTWSSSGCTFPLQFSLVTALLTYQTLFSTSAPSGSMTVTIAASLGVGSSYYFYAVDSAYFWTSARSSYITLNTPFTLNLLTPTIYTMGAATVNVDLRRSVSTADLYVCYSQCTWFESNNVATRSLPSGVGTAWQFVVPLSAALSEAIMFSFARAPCAQAR